MKKLMFSLALLTGMIATASISNSTKTNTTNRVQQSYNYDLEWEAFKQAVYANNADDLRVFLSEEMEFPTATDLCSWLHVDWVMNEMKKTEYTDLKDYENEGNYYKEFSVISSYHDEESGEDFESGIFLYFSEDMSGRLLLVNVLMAG